MAKSTLSKNKQGYGYLYTDLAQINSYCEENEITYYQEVETSEINQKDYIVTYITKDGETTKHRLSTRCDSLCIITSLSIKYYI